MILDRKNGFLLYQEVLTFSFSTIIILLVLFFSYSQLSYSNEKFSKLAPEISYQYPQASINTFLHTQLNNINSTYLKNNYSKIFSSYDKILIKDILKYSIYDGDEKLQNLVSLERLDFLKTLDGTSINSFNDFSESKFEVNDLIHINKLSYIPNSLKCDSIKDSIFYLPILGKEKDLYREFRVISFQKLKSTC